MLCTASRHDCEGTTVILDQNTDVLWQEYLGVLSRFKGVCDIILLECGIMAMHVPRGGGRWSFLFDNHTIRPHYHRSLLDHQEIILRSATPPSCVIMHVLCNLSWYTAQNVVMHICSAIIKHFTLFSYISLPHIWKENLHINNLLPITFRNHIIGWEPTVEIYNVIFHNNQ